jgi:hypothetical protein
MFDKLIEICRKPIPSSGDVHDSYTSSTSRIAYGDLYTPRSMNSARR